jgi:hypothetical protein
MKGQGWFMDHVLCRWREGTGSWFIFYVDEGMGLVQGITLCVDEGVGLLWNHFLLDEGGLVHTITSSTQKMIHEPAPFSSSTQKMIHGLVPSLHLHNKLSMNQPYPFKHTKNDPWTSPVPSPTKKHYPWNSPVPSPTKQCSFRSNPLINLATNGNTNNLNLHVI